MSEKTPHTPTLHNETIRDSGLVVPGVYGENPTEATVTLPTAQEVSRYGKTNEAALSDEQKTEQLYELHRKAYQDILDPRHVIELKDEIEVALSRVGTRSQNVNTGLDVNKEKQSARAKIIEEYLHIGDPDKTRPISDDLRESLDTLLAQPIKLLEKKIKEASKEGVDVSKADNPVETSTPEDLKTKESRVEEARAAVEDALETNKDIEPKDEHIKEDIDDVEDEAESESVNDETKEEDPKSLSSEEQEVVDQIQAEIDAIDLISNYSTRLKKLTEYAKAHNGQKDPLGRDIGVMAAKRIDKSSARSPLNPRRYTIRFGKSRRLYNKLLSDMAMEGPNLEAARSMKRNYDIRYRKIDQGKNKTIFEVSKIAEKDIAELPSAIEKLHLRINQLKQDIAGSDGGNLETRLEQVGRERDELIRQGEQLSPHQVADLERLTREEVDINHTLSRIDTDKKTLAKLEKELDTKSKVYDKARSTVSAVDESIDNLFPGASRYRAEIIADRATRRKDASILAAIVDVRFQKIRQAAHANIIVEDYKDRIRQGVSDQQKAEYKTRALEEIDRQISNKKIKDKATASLI